MNIAKDFLEENNIDLESFDGKCSQLAINISEWASGRGLETSLLRITPKYGNLLLALYPAFGAIKNSNGRLKVCGEEVYIQWRYHVVLMGKGLVHDPWYTKPIKINEYLPSVFLGQSLLLKHSCKAGELLETWENKGVTSVKLL